MRTSSLRAGDIVQCNKRGRLFYAKIVTIDATGTLLVEPIERNISYRHIEASEISDHWAHAAKTRRGDRPPKTQTTPELSLPL